MELVDTHAHLEEVVDLDAALARAKQAGVIAIIAVGSDLASNQRVLGMARKYPEFVYPALGLHPGNLGDDSHREATFQLMESNLERAVAIGEIGLDYHYPELGSGQNGGVKPAQRQAFCRALTLAQASGKPALIHSRGAWQDCLALAQEMKVEKAVFHWFSGPQEVLKQVVAEGYFISATPAAQYSHPHRQALAPVERLLLETDSPVVYRGEAAEPAHVLKTLKAVSEIKGVDPDLLARTTTANAVRLFQIRID